jgi:hypothetical protein
MQSPSLALSVILCCLASWFHQASAINFLALPSAFGGSCAEVHQVRDWQVQCLQPYSDKPQAGGNPATTLSLSDVEMACFTITLC